jgi:hypothetical protein
MGRNGLPRLSFASRANNKGARQNQQQARSHKLAGPAIGKGKSCSSAEAKENSQSRNGIDRIASSLAPERNFAVNPMSLAEAANLRVADAAENSM